MNRKLVILLLLLVAFKGMAQPLKEYSFVSLMNGFSEFVTDSNTIVELPIWGYGNNNGWNSPITIPGPTVYAKEGDSVYLEMVNPSMEGHTIHLHGLDVDEANDGVPHHTGFILQGDSFTYRFKATHAGNFLYHCHVTTTMHLALGMYGMVIVYPADSSQRVYTNGPLYDRQYEYLLSDLDARWNKDYTKIGGFLTYDPDMFLINGRNKSLLYSDTNVVMSGQVGDQLLMRILNVGYRVNRVVFPEELHAVVHTADGRVLSESFSSDTLIVYPGERYSVLAEVLDASPTYARVDFLDPYRLRYIGCEYIPINDDDFAFIPYQEKDALQDSIFLANEAPSSTSLVNIFPNPTSGAVLIHSTTSVDQVHVFDLRGRMLEKVVFPSSSAVQELDLSGLSNGYYFLKIYTGSSGVSSFKKVQKF